MASVTTAAAKGSLEQKQLEEGRRLVDRDGHDLGALKDVYVDAETAEELFATVEEGLFVRHLTFVPLRGAQENGDSTVVRVSRRAVAEAPNISLHGDELSSLGESALYHHYGLTYASRGRTRRRLVRRMRP